MIVVIKCLKRQLLRCKSNERETRILVLLELMSLTTSAPFCLVDRVPEYVHSSKEDTISSMVLPFQLNFTLLFF